MIHYRTAPAPVDDPLARALKQFSRDARDEHCNPTSGNATDDAAASSATASPAQLCVFDQARWRSWFAAQRAVLDDDNGRLRRLVREIPAAPLFKPLRPAPSDAALLALKESFPNYAAVIDHLLDAAELSRFPGGGMRMAPVLLVGPPGLGKTAFASALARVLGTDLQMLPMAHATAGFELGGMDAGWANAKPGAPMRWLVWGDCANPLALLDEIDKAGGDERHNPLGALYTLLEPSTARRFCDEMVSLPIDASAILWLATANDVAPIPRPLLSRFHVFEIAPPTPEQRPAIICSVWRELHSREPALRLRFAPTLPLTTLEQLCDGALSPREAMKWLLSGAARAARAGRDALLPEDLPHSSGNKSWGTGRIGFV